MKFSRCFFIIGVAICLVASSPTASWAISIEEEQRLGKDFVQKVRQEFELLEEPYAVGFLKDLVDLLYAQEQNRPFPISVYIIKKPEMNAFAGPGGHLFMFTGLFEKLEDMDQLAGVIAHELAHVTFRHLNERMAQAYKAGLTALGGMLLGALLGGAPGEAVMAGSMAAGMQMQLAYSREDERQADQLGLKYMLEAGFRPEELLELHKNLQRNTNFAGSKVPPYLLTHPTGPERMANLEAMIRSGGAGNPSPKERYLREIYPFVRAIAISGSRDTADARRLFSDLLKGRSPRPEYLLGLAMAEEGDRDFGEAIRHLRMAVNMAPHITMLQGYLGRVLVSAGEAREAVDCLSNLLKRAPDDQEATYLMAEAMLDLGRDQEALTFLKRLSYTDKPEAKGLLRPDIYYKMANIYGRQGKLDLAHFNLGIYQLRTGDVKKAQFHLNKALSTTADEKLKDTIKDLLKEIKQEGRR